MWCEVADRVFVRAYDHLDINICVVRDNQDLLLVDSRASSAEAVELEADLQVFGPARVVVLVNTHAHFDHTFGNQQFGPESALNVPIFGHHLLPAHLERYERPRLAAWRAGTGNEPDRDWQQVRITPPTNLVNTRTTLQIGERTVELCPMGPGHTDTDLVVHVADARTWIVGDVVEASGPPMYGSGCYPLALPEQLEALLAEIHEHDVVVPGHGPVVDRTFVVTQLADVTQLAQQLRLAHRSRATVEEALLDQRRWPFPVEGLELAVRRAYATLDQEPR
jgi:glyoxylase-like metal-dependent hydrolase (beta-lactamase superfamily II)